MPSQAPVLDPRSEVQLAQEVRERLAVHVPEWHETDPASGAIDRVGGAVIGAFAHLAATVVERLNRAPDKNFLAFVDLLGAAPLPPQPARAPLAFSLAAASPTDAVVPAGTRVAAPPAEGEKEPILFETERELVVTAARLDSVFVRAPDDDRYADYSSLVTAAAGPVVSAFQGDPAIEHILYIGHDALLGYAGLRSVVLSFVVGALPASPDARSLQWQEWNGTKWAPITPDSDGTADLTLSGDVTFSNRPPLLEQTIQSVTSRWLRCQLMTPITPATAPVEGKVRASQLPTITAVGLEVEVNDTGLHPDAAFANAQAVDLSKPFFPFGEKPKYGDTLYLAHREAFAAPGTTITVHLVNPFGDPASPIPPTLLDGNAQLAWEFWDGGTWQTVGIANVRMDTNTPQFTDTTQAFTKSGDLVLVFPRSPALATVNGVRAFWIRVRLVSGNYGTDAHYERSASGSTLVPASFAPPAIDSVTVKYTFTRSGPPDAVLASNDFEIEARDPATPFAPFAPTRDVKPTIYLGFVLPAGRPTFPNRTLTLYWQTADIRYGEAADNLAAAVPARLAWEYWNGLAWTSLTTSDGTEALTRPGLVEFLPPADTALREEFGLARYWFRARWESGDYAFLPRVRRLLPNATTAVQTVTTQNEPLGASNGREDQAFRTTRAPVLLGQQLEVREPDLPPVQDQTAIRADEGPDAITVTGAAAGGAREVWVRWHEVPDFYGSGPRDRHYVLDHLTGEVRFGDGLSGMIPPAGTGNVRLARYQTGGGVRGNRAAGAIVQLKQTVPYVEKVASPEPATGGADAEGLDSVLQRAPRTVRHRGRAVTLEDYEDLAMLASPEVARAKCVPLRNLTTDPDAQQTRVGVVSLVVVPRSRDPKPMPAIELLERVRRFVVENAIPTTDVVVVGPDYVRVDVAVELALRSLEGVSAVEAAALEALTRFLHPLTGGLDGTGWDFSRRPHRSDLFAWLEAVPGVDHVRSLQVTETEDRVGASRAGRFLVYSGAHTVALIYEAP